MSDQRVQKFITSRSPNCVYVLKDKLINKLNTPEFANSDDVSTVAVYLETCFDFFFSRNFDFILKMVVNIIFS